MKIKMLYVLFFGCLSGFISGAAAAAGGIPWMDNTGPHTIYVNVQVIPDGVCFMLENREIIRIQNNPFYPDVLYYSNDKNGIQYGVWYRFRDQMFSRANSHLIGYFFFDKPTNIWKQFAPSVPPVAVYPRASTQLDYKVSVPAAPHAMAFFPQSPSKEEQRAQLQRQIDACNLKIKMLSAEQRLAYLQDPQIQELELEITKLRTQLRDREEGEQAAAAAAESLESSVMKALTRRIINAQTRSIFTNTDLFDFSDLSEKNRALLLNSDTIQEFADHVNAYSEALKINTNADQERMARAIINAYLMKFIIGEILSKDEIRTQLAIE